MFVLMKNKGFLTPDELSEYNGLNISSAKRDIKRAKIVHFRGSSERLISKNFKRQEI